MQNEFEKQVQQKLEELKLVPSEPVWEKVEMQIRKKKDRRRMIFWIPLFAFIGAGLWLGIDQYSNRAAYNKVHDKTPKQNPVETPVLNKKAVRENQIVIGNKKSADRNELERTEITGTNFSSNVLQKNFSKQIRVQKEVSLVQKKNSQSKVEKPFVETETSNVHSQLQDKQNTSNNSLTTIQNIDTATTKQMDTNAVAKEPIKQDSIAVSKPGAKKHASSKWKYNLVIAAGASGLGRIDVYNGQKSLYVYSPPAGASGGGSQSANYGPSEVEKGFAFAVGAIAKRQLGRKTFFSTGLQYNYYSNTIQVGSKVNQNTRIMDYMVTQFYSNQSTALQTYKNQYHFISVPADFDWQLLKKHPLDLSIGLSFQYLLQTNALRFDYSTQSYFHDVAAFNRSQLFSVFALSYSVPLKQKPFTFGPQLQYGFTRLEKGNADHHLFSYSLKAQWQFKK
jgi:hypothetical protein